MELKDRIIKMYQEEIQEIEKDKKEKIEEIEELNKEIDECNTDIAEIESKIKKVENSDADSLGKPSTTIRGGTMGLSDKMAEIANNWIIKHEMEKHSDIFYGITKPTYKGAIGCADYEVSWNMTSIGYLAGIRCTKCDEECYLGED